MIVHLNDREIEIFSGARVRDVVLKFSEEAYREVISGKISVTDHYRNPVEPRGEVSGGQQFYLPFTPKENSEEKTDEVEV